MATKFLDYTGLSHLWSKFKEWCNSIFVTKATDENITGTKTFVGSKKIAFKQSGANDKLGFTLFNNSGKEQGYLEYNPLNKIAGVPLMTLGNYATADNELTYVGFRRYSNISGASGAYNLLTPLISDAKTPFNLTTTYTNFYLPLGISNGSNIVTASNSGIFDISSLFPSISTIEWSDITSKPTTISGYDITDAKIDNGTITLGSNSITPLTSHQDISGKVNKSGDTMTGGLTITNNNVLQFKHTGITRGTAPSTNAYPFFVVFKDNADKTLGGLYYEYFTNKSAKTHLMCYQGTTNVSTWNSIGIGYNASGDAFTWAPTPATSDNTTQIATTAFVKAQGYITSSGSITGSAAKLGTSTIGSSVQPIYLNAGTATAVNSALKSCYAVVASEAVTNNIFKIASGSMGYAYNGLNLVILIQNIMGGNAAIWRISLNVGATVGVYSAGTSVLVDNIGLDPANFIVAYKSNSGGNLDFELYTKIAARYAGYRFTVIQECWRANQKLGNILTLYNQLTTTGTAAITSGYTALTTTKATVGMNISGNAATATETSYLQRHEINTTDYEMTYTDFIKSGCYTVNTFKSNTLSAPRDNVGDYRLYCFSDNSYYNNFLCASPRQSSLFFGHFWEGVFQGWNEVATVNTSQTITGTKTLTANLYIKNDNITRGTAPSNDQERVFYFYDSADNKTGAFSSLYRTDKSSRNAIYAYNTTTSTGNTNIGYLGIGCTSSGSVYTFSPTPASSDNSTQIATTAFVKNQAYASNSAVVHNSGNETISGTKTFNNMIRGTIEAPLHVTASTTPSSTICSTVVAVCDDNSHWISELYYCREAGTNNSTTVLRTWSKDQSAAAYMAVNYDEANRVGYLNFDNLYKDIRIANASFRRNGTRNDTAWWSIAFRGNNSNSDMGSVHQFVDANGQAEVEIRCAFDNSTYSYKNFWIWTKKDGTSAAGVEADVFRPTMNTYVPLGLAGAGRWGQLYSTSGTINTSDERLKCEISSIPDEILDAWESCEFYQYKMKDSVNKKGENARYHTGMIAQRLDTKFKNANKNLNKYGLFCYDEWKASKAKRDDHGKITEPAVEAGNEYSIRYEEALCMEAAYQRRKNKILEKRISELEKRLAKLEGTI